MNHEHLFHSVNIALIYRFQVDDTATAILKKKKKPNSLMYVNTSERRPDPSGLTS